MEYILLLISIYILFKGIKNIVTGQAFLWDKKQTVLNASIARFVGVLYAIAGLSYIMYYLFTNDDISLGYHLRKALDDNYEIMTYWFQDNFQDYGQQIFLVSGILGFLINLFATKKSLKE